MAESIHAVNEEPLFEHDCDKCKFLGRYTYGASFMDGPRETTVDLYSCKGRFELSLIARFSSEGPDYSSFPLDAVEIIEARGRTKEETGTYTWALFEALRRYKSEKASPRESDVTAV